MNLKLARRENIGNCVKLANAKNFWLYQHKYVIRFPATFPFTKVEFKLKGEWESQKTKWSKRKSSEVI